MYLEKVDGPEDLKKLSVDECLGLAEEIRKVLIKRTSEIGGHLGSNLGFLEATIALHYVFESPKDKIVFDVSHQCYTHKILTGRKTAFIERKNYMSVNGYTNPVESKHDLFRVGHTATSISLACGLAKARDLKNESNNVIAIIGDGSMSGGEALEGLDYAGSELKSNLIVILNDNQMSIAENHGGLYNNLSLLRRTNGKAEKNIFSALGYDYRYVHDGNDFKALINIFQDVKDIDHPVLIHICTKKGNGYRFTELNKEKGHWMRPFDIDSGEEKKPFNGERYDRIVRDYLIDKMSTDKKIVTLIAAVPNALSMTKEYRNKCGKQLIDVGICEEHAIAMAAGLAKNGCKPVFATLSTFYQRTYDQISQELCLNSLPATMIVVDGSVYASNDVTHVGIFDIPMMSNIPNLVYLAPTNKQEYLAMLDWSIEQTTCPVAIRAPRNGVYYADGPVDLNYNNLNKYKTMIAGYKVAIIALGDFYQLGEKVQQLIKKELKINSTLINPRYITGIDEELLGNLLENHEIVITLEDGILDGGFGEKISRFYGDKNMKVINYGLKKEFLDRYNINDILIRNRLMPELIVEDIEKMLFTS